MTQGGGEYEYEIGLPSSNTKVIGETVASNQSSVVGHYNELGGPTIGSINVTVIPVMHVLH